MAIRSNISFDLTAERWNELSSIQNTSKIIKHLDASSSLNKGENGKFTVYSLWVDDKIVSFAECSYLNLDKEYLVLEGIASDPSQNNKGYASLLLWEMFLGQDEPILIGGALSKKDEKFILSFLKTYSSHLTSEPEIVDLKSGERIPYSPLDLFKKPKYSLVLESSFINYEVGSLGWAFNKSLFEEE